MPRFETFLNVLIIFILAGVLLGGFGVQVILKEEPCPLCLLQRLYMLAVAAGAILNLSFGSRPAHYALILVSSLMGGFIALRQISLHVCPGFPAYGDPILGLSLYTWSFIIFACTVAWVALSLVAMKHNQVGEPKKSLWINSAYWLIVLVSLGNIFTSYRLCSFGMCGD